MAQDGASEQAALLPFYLALDASWSMTETGEDLDNPSASRLDVANRIAPEIAEAVLKDPAAGDRVRLGVVSFSGETTVDLPLIDIRNLKTDDIPVVNPRQTGTSYASLFLTLRHQIESDVATLKAQGFKVARPTIFMISDGEPNDASDNDWKEAFTALTDKSFKAHPNVVPYGVGEASHTVLDHVAKYKASLDGAPAEQHVTAFLLTEVGAAAALERLIPVLVGSIVGSAADGTSNGLVLQSPDTADDDDLLDDDDLI